MVLETLKIIELELAFSVLDECPLNWERPLNLTNEPPCECDWSVDILFAGEGAENYTNLPPRPRNEYE